jgi:CDP-6-deoxy-D-xylo-4-hexulose-3-dehydrase
MTKNFSHPLMDNNILPEDLKRVINFLQKKKIILTQSKFVKKFENEWSKWLGVKYSVFVNSGSSANILSMSILKILSKKKEVIVPSLTWVSDINSVIINNFKPKFVDINLNNLSMDLKDVRKKINKNTAAVFLTHAQGYNGLNQEFLNFLKRKKIPLIEDVCESHGAFFKKKKLGSFGLISNFSFYYAHHLSTIEGGMVCTNDKKIYELAKMIRSHGMVRESGNKKFEKSIVKKNPQLSPKFIFLHQGYNFRNNEIGAVIGSSQLKRLDKNNKLRTRNFKYFLKNLDKKKYFIDYDLEGSSNYAFPIILKTQNIKKRNKFEKILMLNEIEFRRGNAGGGNQLRQPYLKEYTKNINLKNFKNVEHVNSFGYYIGNYPSLKISKIKKLCDILNSIIF